MKKALLIGLALATGAAPRLAAQEEMYRDWLGFVFRRDRGMTTGTVAGAPDSVYRVLRRLAQDLGLKADVEDEGTRQFGAKRQRAYRQLGKTAVSAYLNCGDGLMGPNANTWYVYLNFGAQVEPAGSGSSVTLMLNAQAADVPNGGNQRLPCTSTGRLEMALVNRLAATFGGAPPG
ncbi:MAG: hypothetical protein AB7L66_01755 [Gemmatimonadales bacterium]